MHTFIHTLLINIILTLFYISLLYDIFTLISLHEYQKYQHISDQPFETSLGVHAGNVFEASLCACWICPNGTWSLFLGVVVGQRAPRWPLVGLGDGTDGHRSFFDGSPLFTMNSRNLARARAQDILVKAERMREPGQTTLLSSCLLQEEVFELPQGAGPRTTSAESTVLTLASTCLKAFHWGVIFSFSSITFAILSPKP